MEEKRRKREKFEVEVEEFQPSVKAEPESQADRPVRACRTQQGRQHPKLNPPCVSNTVSLHL